MIKRIIYVAFSILIISCSSQDRPPKEIIQPEEMKKVLWDVMSAQVWAGEAARKDSLVNLATETKVLTDKVFQMHRIDSAKFNKSYNWYLKHPVILKPIFDSLYLQKQRTKNLHLKEPLPV